MYQPLLVLYKMDGCPYCTPLLAKGSPLEALRGTVRVKVADSRDSISNHVTSYPTLELVLPNRVYNYEGKRDARSIKKWVKQLIR
jgi:hypothetical protein